MELIRISERKLKIMLTPMDMCHFELNSDLIGDDSAKTHRAFRLLLEEIRKQTDFDTDDHHLSIQYFPSKEGGCEMFISRLQHEESERHRDSIVPYQPKENNLKPVHKTGSFKKECVYRFLSLSALLSACRRLISVGIVTESAVYREETGDYLLFLKFFSGSPFAIPDELDFLVEYGSLENAAHLRLYIREHANLIASPNAISTLGVLG